MLLKKLFQKNKKNDIERYKGEKEKADKEQVLLIMEELVNKVPDNVVYTKQIEDGTYVFANYWNDGTLLMYNPEGEDGFGEFVNDLEKEESWNLEKNFEEKQKKEKMDVIVETLKKNPALAMDYIGSGKRNK